MQTNPNVQDEIYRIVGEELARKEYHPGPMARAVAESQGKRELVESLYIRFRHEELLRDAETEVERRQELQREESGKRTCPKCGARAKPKPLPRGNVRVFGAILLCSGALFLTLLSLSLLEASYYVIPGTAVFILFYVCTHMGYRGVCENCQATIVERDYHEDR